MAWVSNPFLWAADNSEYFDTCWAVSHISFNGDIFFTCWVRLHSLTSANSLCCAHHISNYSKKGDDGKMWKTKKRRMEVAIVKITSYRQMF